jgi:hypothetical protein
MKNGLHVAPGVTWPIDAVTETFWWCGKRGSGKTHDCSVFVEELLQVGVQVVVIDPMRAWWGLRSSVDGRSPGFPIPIFGGPHGDAPLEEGGGTVLADFAMAEGVSMVLDIKGWSKAARRRFVSDFLARLMQANTAPLHLVVEETPIFAPQRPAKGDEGLLGIVEEVVRLGRGSGLGFSAVSQRSAHLNAEVRAQIEVLVAHRTPAPLDRAAIKGWFDVHDPERVTEAMGRLPFLATGTAIVSSTEFLSTFGEVPFRRRTTFDSSATPKVGVAIREPRTLADIDLSGIQQAMAATIEKAKQDDPKALRAEVLALRGQLAAAEKEAEDWRAASGVSEVEVEIRIVEVPALSDADRAFLEDLRTSMEAAAFTMEKAGPAFAAWVADIEAATAQARTALEPDPAPRPSVPPERPHRATREQPPQPGVEHWGADPLPPPTSRPVPARPGSSRDSAPRRILMVLAQHGPMPAARAGFMAKVSSTKSTLRNALSSLRKQGSIAENGELVSITDAGRAELGSFDPLPTGAALLEHWRGEIGNGKPRDIFEALLAAYPDEVPNAVLAERLGIDPGVSTLRNGLSTLRSLGVVEGNRVSPALMEAVHG